MNARKIYLRNERFLYSPRLRNVSLYWCNWFCSSHTSTSYRSDVPKLKFSHTEMTNFVSDIVNIRLNTSASDIFIHRKIIILPHYTALTGHAYKIVYFLSRTQFSTFDNDFFSRWEQLLEFFSTRSTRSTLHIWRQPQLKITYYHNIHCHELPLMVTCYDRCYR